MNMPRRIVKSLDDTRPTRSWQPANHPYKGVTCRFSGESSHGHKPSDEYAPQRKSSTLKIGRGFGFSAFSGNSPLFPMPSPKRQMPLSSLAERIAEIPRLMAHRQIRSFVFILNSCRSRSDTLIESFSVNIPLVAKPEISIVTLTPKG